MDALQECYSHGSSLLAKSSGSWLGDQSVQKARDRGHTCLPPAPRPSVPRLCGCQHPMPRACFYPLVLGALLATAVGIKIPVCLLATKQKLKLHPNSLSGPVSDSVTESEFISTHIPWPVAPSNHNPIHIKAPSPKDNSQHSCPPTSQPHG